MRKDELLYKLKGTISADEYRLLEDNEVPHISEFNRNTLLEMMRRRNTSCEEIATDQVDALRRALEKYLSVYLPENQAAWKWIILSCLYLRFVCDLPMHPKEIVHYTRIEENGKSIYIRPAKSSSEDSVCIFCICK